MPIYVYQTIPSSPEQKPVVYELWQSMRDATYTQHPETGEPIRRVMIGGIGMPGSITDPSADRPSPPRAAGN